MHVEVLLDLIDDQSAQVVRLSIVEGLSHAEIAEIAEISVRAVEGRLRRARKALRQAIHDTRADQSGF